MGRVPLSEKSGGRRPPASPPHYTSDIDCVSVSQSVHFKVAALSGATTARTTSWTMSVDDARI